MNTVIAALVLVCLAPLTPSHQAQEKEERHPAGKTEKNSNKAFFSALDRFYTWGDIVERFRCRVHGRWIRYSKTAAESGQFWGDLEYKKGKFRLSITRTLGPARREKRVEKDIHTLMEQAGLLPTGFPVPKGVIRRRQGNPDRDTEVYDVVPRSVVPRSVGAPGTVSYFFRKNRMVEVILPQKTNAPLRLEVLSRSIPGDRVLITQLIHRDFRSGKFPWISYHYHYLAGNYFPRAIIEDRKGESISLLFYSYEIHMKE